ncbi:hypothetical protein [Candidatus Karelsulcia muelleri]
MNKKSNNNNNNNKKSKSNKNKKNSSIESQLKDIYRLQLIHLRLKYLNYIINLFPVFVLSFLFFLKQKKIYLFFLTQRLKTQTQLLRSNYKLKIYKNKLRNLLKIKSLTKQKLKKLEMDIEYNSMDFLLKKIKTLKKKKHLLINSRQIKQMKKYIRIKELLFKTKIINYKQKTETIKQNIICLKQMENQLKQNLNKNLLKRYKQITYIFPSGIAVVPVYKKIPFGTYILITQPKYYELLERKKIIIEEISGRILIDFYLANKENNKMKKILFNFS